MSIFHKKVTPFAFACLTAFQNHLLGTCVGEKKKVKLKSVNNLWTDLDFILESDSCTWTVAYEEKRSLKIRWFWRVLKISTLDHARKNIQIGSSEKSSKGFFPWNVSKFFWMTKWYSCSSWKFWKLWSLMFKF